jgi:hypothetical protein
MLLCQITIAAEAWNKWPSCDFWRDEEAKMDRSVIERIRQEIGKIRAYPVPASWG